VSGALASPDLHGFCVHGGAPLVGPPLVDARGRLYLVTQDGYLHAYEGDGRFRFSFTMAGTPLGSASLRAADGVILVGTTARLVYGITSEGQLAFRAHTVTPVWSGLYPRDAASVVYIGLDRFLYALSNGGAALYRVAIPGQPVGEPAVGAGGVVWIPLDGGVARLEQAFSARRFALNGPADGLGLGAQGPLVVSGGTLYAFDARGLASSLGPAETVLGDGTSVLALDGAGGGAWFEGGDPARRVGLGPYPALAPSGRGGLAGRRALLPLATGELGHLDVTQPDEPRAARVQVLREPLTGASFTRGVPRVLVTSRSGQACLLDDPFAAARGAHGSR